MEGFNAMLETSDTFDGLTTPDGVTQIRHVGYADDTCIPIRHDEEQIGALENMLHTFQMASGNNIKKA